MKNLKSKKKTKKLSKKLSLRIKDKFKFHKFDVRILFEQFYCIMGPQRSGKTSLDVALMDTIYKKYNKQLISQSIEYIDNLNMQGHTLFLRKKHLFYSNHEHILDKKNKCHGLEFEDMVIPREDFKGQHFPYGSFLEFQEIDQECDNRKWQKFDLGHKDFFKYFGHNGLTIGSDTQDYAQCDSKVRGLFTSLILVYGRERVKRWWHIKPRYTWYFFLKNNQVAEALKDFAGYVKIDIPIVQAYKFTYKGEIHNKYHSRSNAGLFLNHLENYKFRKSKQVDLSPVGVAKFCKQYENIYFKSTKDKENK